jgi:hypothetical protein
VVASVRRTEPNPNVAHGCGKGAKRRRGLKDAVSAKTWKGTSVESANQGYWAPDRTCWLLIVYGYVKAMLDELEPKVTNL